MLVRDHVAFITGSARGLGLGIARRFIEEGGSVVLGDLDAGATAAAARELSPDGSRAAGIAVDVTDAQSLERARKFCVERFLRVDAVVVNAGVNHTGDVIDTPLEDWKRVIDVNLTGAFLTAQVFARQLLEQGSGGSIVFLSSQVGKRGEAGAGAYSSSKFGVIGLTKCLALELAPQGVTVNAICPGTIKTHMIVELMKDRAAEASISLEEQEERQVRNIPMGRMGSEAEVGDLAVFLSSPLSRYISGEAISIDGAFLAG